MSVEARMGRLDGKVAVITGGARGQGRSHAVTFAREGADVAVCDITKQPATMAYPVATAADLAETARLVEEQGRRCVAVEADVRDLAQMQQFAETAMAELGRIDILIANAGVLSFRNASSLDLTAEEWQETIDVNLTGVWVAAKAVVPHIIAGGRGGSVVITSSDLGIKGSIGLGHYAASKHAVVGLARTLAMELAPHSIRVNTVHPCGTRTTMVNNEPAQRFFADTPGHGEKETLLPVDMVEPEDISNAMLWLCSEEARYVTGISLPVDAGTTQR
jgi:(+)-trans-carveol dehydrogenase